jgi:hypothetical protein
MVNPLPILIDILNELLIDTLDAGVLPVVLSLVTAAVSFILGVLDLLEFQQMIIESGLSLNEFGLFLQLIVMPILVAGPLFLFVGSIGVAVPVVTLIYYGVAIAFVASVVQALIVTLGIKESSAGVGGVRDGVLRPRILALRGARARYGVARA